MAISEEKMRIVIDNYFKAECDVNTSIRQAFEKGFRIGVKKGLSAQPKQRWISMTERPPKPGEQVLVTTNGDDYYVWDCRSNRGDNYFWEDESGYYHNKYDVIAWMPLPEPYGWRQENEYSL